MEIPHNNKIFREIADWFNQIQSEPFAIKSYELRDRKTFLGHLSARSAGRRFSLYSNYWMRKPKTEFD
jgi:hypothetical protein